MISLIKQQKMLSSSYSIQFLLRLRQTLEKIGVKTITQETR
ncbi:hypothetical protein BLGI_1325 [Brevibacillus laterosporus GI-9]|nr:hypothetical protein BLGI_1325 [Brevibacillus laterosporus GI-9]